MGNVILFRFLRNGTRLHAGAELLSEGPGEDGKMQPKSDLVSLFSASVRPFLDAGKLKYTYSYFMLNN
jgi:hypothetical protein